MSAKEQAYKTNRSGERNEDQKSPPSEDQSAYHRASGHGGRVYANEPVIRNYAQRGQLDNAEYRQTSQQFRSAEQHYDEQSDYRSNDTCHIRPPPFSRIAHM
jgi:hypothetical protein